MKLIVLSTGYFDMMTRCNSYRAKVKGTMAMWEIWLLWKKIFVIHCWPHF